MTPRKYPLAKMEDVFSWFEECIFSVLVDEDGNADVYKGDRKLTQRINSRKGMEGGDPRVTLSHDGSKRDCNVSQLVWMCNTSCVIPDDFEVHHIDENPLNNSFENLLLVHKNDHPKLHRGSVPEEWEDW